MRKSISIIAICLFLIGSASAQKSKPWTEWSKKDADKMLNDSAWAQSQTKGEAPPAMDKNPNAGRDTNAGPSSNPVSTEYNIRVRFASAKPIREGLARRIVLSQPEKASELTGQLQPIVDKGFGDFIVVAVNVEAQDSRIANGYLMGLARLTPAMLAGKVYLERKDGKRLELLEYKTPIADGMGGKFIFPRTLDGKPFLAADSDSVRFVLNLSDKMKVDAKFKVSGMMYGDMLEY